MNYRVSRNIGFQVDDIEKATKFYGEVLGFHKPDHSEVEEVEFQTQHNTVFLIDGEHNLGPVMELIVSDLEEAKQHLLKNNCEIVRWEGKGKDCYIRDPFGMVFNVWEDKTVVFDIFTRK